MYGVSSSRDRTLLLCQAVSLDRGHRQATREQIASKKHLILLDYETNVDIENAKKPLSHAHLVKMRLEGLL